MRLLVLIPHLLLGIHAVRGATHSLRYVYTATTGIAGFPEFVDVGMLDGQVISYYDSSTREKVPRQDWMRDGLDQQYWDSGTQNMRAAEEAFRQNLPVAQQRFNQTAGVHTYQAMYGCDWDDETGVTDGYDQIGYDGEDFLSFDLASGTWVAPVPQAVITKHKWERKASYVRYEQRYLTQECIAWLRKYLTYGEAALQRTVPPSMSLFQKRLFAPVTCHATGFYPRAVTMFWRRDGEKVSESVDEGETLPNHDGTFQKSVDLRVSADDWESGGFECVVQISGTKEDSVTTLKRDTMPLLLNTPDDPKSSPLATGLGIAVTIPVIMLIVGLRICYWTNGCRYRQSFLGSDGETYFRYRRLWE